MPVPTHAVNVVSLLLCLSLLALQNGCSNSGSGDAQAPATNPAATLSLALTTTNGVTAIVADGQSTVPIRITVANGVGTPMSGVSVTFATTDGTLSASPVVRVAQGLSRTDLGAVSRANGNSLTVSTDTNGIAQVLLTASTTAGVAIVTADVQGFRTHVDISFAAGPAARVQLDTSTSTVSAGGTATLTATVTDANGNPVPGETVMFTFSTNTSGASLSPTSGVTNSNGQTTVTYTAGSTGGADTVRALATSTSVAGSVSITVTATSAGGGSAPVVTGPVNSLFLRSISSTSIGVRGSGTNETSTLTFEARDSNGNLVQAPAPSVNFTLDSGGLGGGESLSPLKATAASGQVMTTLKSGTKAGTVKVIAFIDANKNDSLDASDVTSLAISVVVTGGPPWGENLGIVPQTLNIPCLVTVGITDIITTFLSDRFSNPVPDGTAVFFSSNPPSIPGTATSNSSGGTTVATATAPFTCTPQVPSPPNSLATVTASTLSGSEARVLSLAVDPTNANVIYAGTDGGGVFRTTNGLNPNGDQVSWTQVGSAQTGLTNGIIRDIQIDPTNTSISYAATDAGVFWSTGGGDTWTSRSGREQIAGEILSTITALPQMFTLAFPSDGNRARTVVRVNGVETLFYLFVGAQDIQLLPEAGSHGNTVSIDYDLGAAISVPRITALALDPTHPLPTDPATTRTLYAGTQGGGVFRSRNSGFSWDGINIGLSDTDILSLVALSPDTLYAGTFGGGVFRTFNATAAIPIWCQVNTGLTSTVINTLATDKNRTNVYAGTFLGGVFFLTGGKPSVEPTDCRTATVPSTWMAPTTNVNTLDILNGFVSDIVTDPNNPTILYAATLGDGTRSIEGNAAEGGVFKSTDGGMTWTRIPTLPATQLALPTADLPNNRAASLGLSAANSDALYVGVAGRNIVRLTPSTATFTPINGTPPTQLTNNIFASTTVLFSGRTRNTRLTLTPNIGGSCRLSNGASQSFTYIVSDQNGNPITAGSTITVTASAGLLSGITSFTILDTQRGSTVFNVTLQNNVVLTVNTPVTLTVSVNSPLNGNPPNASVPCLFTP